MNAAAFLRDAIEVFFYKIDTILTDNGIAFADLPKNRTEPDIALTGDIFGRTCAENSITHKLIKPHHPWTNGQAERLAPSADERHCHGELFGGTTRRGKPPKLR
jgi:transposase InsO family protein